MTSSSGNPEQAPVLESESVVESYYKKIVRYAEYYIFLCFIAIVIIPLLEFDWVPGLVKAIYLTGFPLLLSIILFSFVKEPVLDMLKRKYEPAQASGKQRRSSN